MKVKLAAVDLMKRSSYLKILGVWLKSVSNIIGNLIAPLTADLGFPYELILVSS